MKLEDQVCSLENAKKLAELGVARESLFVYAKENGQLIPYPLHECLMEYVTPAYTVAELGEMLPEDTIGYREGVAWVCQNGDVGDYREAGTEADARALMLIWLIENGHVTP